MNWLKLLSHHRLYQKKRSTINPNEVRSTFEQDFDRIIFSHPFRRLQDKTQVFPLPEYDFVHTRLTHSLEVSSVGRSLGKKAGENIIKKYPVLAGKKFTEFDFGAIVAAAALAHDLGNPPFGHSGEEAISDFFRNNDYGLFFKKRVNEKQWADLINFEGNAQGFRIMNKGGYQGLKLTMATLATFTKYPCESLLEAKDPLRKSQKKYGFFQSEKHIFQELAAEIGLNKISDCDMAWCRHPLAFLVEAADDICYSIIDLEDGCRLGLINFDQTKELLAGILQERIDEVKLSKISNINERLGVLRAMTIGVLIDQCAQAFIENEKKMLSGTFDTALTDIIPAAKTLKQISKLSVEKIYRSRIVLETEAAGFEVINGLLETFLPSVHSYCFFRDRCSSRQKSIVRLLPDEVFTGIDAEEINTYQLIMNMIDYISSMTDSYAISLYRKIKGISLPSGFPTKF